MGLFSGLEKLLGGNQPRFLPSPQKTKQQILPALNTLTGLGGKQLPHNEPYGPAQPAQSAVN
jgi:hypothetical protein